MRLTLLLSAALLTAFSNPTLAQCDEVWSTGWVNNTLGPSHVAGVQDREVADDFEYAGAVGRVIVEGHGPLNGTYPIDGVWVRFYQWTASGPGALQQQYFLAAGDPLLGVLSIPETLDVRLAQPFAASGRHYVSVQVDFAPSGGYWEPWIGAPSGPQLSRAWVRDNAAGGAWGAYVDILGNVVDEDVSFTLYSAPAGSTCSEFVEVSAPVPSPDYTILRDVEVLAADDVWAVGHYQGPQPAGGMYTLAMHYDGSAWSITPTPSPTAGTLAPNDYLWAVEGVASDDVWAGGEQLMQVPGGWVGSQPFALHWDGSTWSEVPTPLPPTSVGAGYTGSSVLEIEAVSNNDVWFLGRWVGPYPGASTTRPAMAMRWDGSSIQLVPTPELAGTQSIHAADAWSASEIWAVGSMSSPTTPYPYVIRWDGAQWSHVAISPAGVTSNVSDVAVLAPNNVWISCTRLVGTTPTNVLLRYNGTGWSQISAPVIGPLRVRAANDVWLGGAQLHHFDGSGWRIAEGPACVPSPSFAALDSAGTELWAVGRQLGAGLTPLTVRRRDPCGAVNYCSSSTTTNGCSPSIASQGSPSASASSGFFLRVSGVEGQRSGLIFYGSSGRNALPWASGSTSYLCVKPPTQRTGAQLIGGTLGGCDGLLSRDWSAFMSANPGALGHPRTPGQQFQAQGWFRDPLAAKTTNLSDALEFTLLP